MPDTDLFAHLDTGPYLAAPQLPLQTLVVLSKSLSSRMPGDPPIYVQVAEAQMRATAEQSEAAMVVRLRETNEARLTVDLNLDNAIDGLWSLFRERIRAWVRYERPGLDFLEDDDTLEVDFVAVRAKAARARELTIELFGEGPLEMLNRTYTEQSQLMANVLRLIKTDELDEELLEIAGEELLPIIKRCQRQYEAMVDRRSSPESGSRTDLRKLRTKLQRKIVRYNSLVLTMLDEDEPESRELVEAMLQPMISLRAQRNTGSGEDAVEVVGEDELVAAPDELPE